MALWTACYLTAFIHSFTGPVVHLFSSCQRGIRVQSLGGHLCEAGILLLALSRYIGDPDVINHCGLVWDGLRPEPTLGHCDDNVIIPLDLTQLFCLSFTLTLGPPSGYTTDIIGYWGEPSGEPAISLHSYTVVYPFASHHEGPEFNPQGGTNVKLGFYC